MVRTPHAPRSRDAGFTLVELLIVVIVLGILAGVVIPQINTATDETKEATVRANLANIRQAISLYRVQHKETYPGQTDWDEFVDQLMNPTNEDGGTSGSTPYGPYLGTNFPENPLAGNGDGQVVATMPASPSGTQGWIYSPVTGEIRANTAGVGPSGIPYFDL